MILCRFMQSFNVPTRMSWGFPAPPGLYIKLWKFLPLQTHLLTGKFGRGCLCASQSPRQIPLGIQKAPFFLFFPKYIVYPWVRRTRARHRGKLAGALCILALVTSSESELWKGNGSLTPGLFSQLPASRGRWDPILLALVGTHLPHLSCNASATLQHFVLLGLVEEVFRHKVYEERKAVWKGT